MPLYDYECTNCGHEASHTVPSSSRDDVMPCSECSAPLNRLFPTNTHTKIGSSVDSMDAGKVTQEKNEKLKKKWSGYKGEEQNLRSQLTAMANEKIENQGNKKCY